MKGALRMAVMMLALAVVMAGVYSQSTKTTRESSRSSRSSWSSVSSVSSVSVESDSTVLILDEESVEVNRTRQDYAYLTYWADGECKQFVGLKGLTAEPQTVQGVSGQPCELAIRCLNNPSSYGCYSLSHQYSDVQVRLNVTVEGGRVVEQENDLLSNFTSSDCSPSSLFQNCFFKYYPQNEFERVFTGTYVIDPSLLPIEPSSSSLLLPSSLLLLSLLFFF